MADASIGVEYPGEFGNPVVRWDAELRAAEKTMASWRKDARMVAERYNLARMKRSAYGDEWERTQYNVLWSNTETMRPAVYGNEPTPVVQRRHKDRDTTGRLASMILERGLVAELEYDERVGLPLDEVLKRSALDLLLEARGVAWVRYDPDFDSDDEEANLLSEHAPVDYLARDEFLHAPKRTWAENTKTGWVARCVSFTREEGVARFGEMFMKVPLRNVASGHDEDDIHDEDRMEVIGQAKVWEVWDARTRKVYWFNRDFQEALLDEADDPLGLEGFFPCPKPAYGTLGNETLVPTPDFMQYSALADELDSQTERIDRLTDALRAAGIYDNSVEGIGRLLDSDENVLIGVPNLQAIAGQGGTLSNVIQFFPLNNIAQALSSLYESRARTKAAIDEISGVSDILRGEVGPYEKLGQSKIKENHAGQRISQRRRSLEHLARGLIRRKAEIMAEHFSPETLRQISSFDLLPEIATLREQAEAAMAAAQEHMQQLQEVAAQAPQPPPPQMPGMMGMGQGMPPGAPPGAPPPGQPPGAPPQPPPDPQQQYMEAVQQHQQAMAEHQEQAQAAMAESRAIEDEIEGLWQGAVELLKNDSVRGFRIEIETNSTVLPKDDEEKQARMDFVETTGTFFERAIPVIDMMPEIAPVLGEMLTFTARGFGAGRQLESALEDFVDRLTEKAAPPEEGEQGPSPEEQAAQQEQQAAEQAAQMDAQKAGIEAQKAQSDMQMKQMEAMAKMRENEAKISVIQAQSQRDIQSAQADMAVMQAEKDATILELQAKLQELEMERRNKREEAILEASKPQPVQAPTPLDGGGLF